MSTPPSIQWSIMREKKIFSYIDSKCLADVTVLIGVFYVHCRPTSRRQTHTTRDHQLHRKKYFYYPRRLCRSAWVGFSSLSVCLSAQHNSETNDPKVFKLGIWNDLGIGILEVICYWS